MTISGNGKITSAPWSKDQNIQATSLIVEEGITDLGSWNFSKNNMKDVTKVSLPKSLEGFGAGIFYYSSLLKTLLIPENISRIEERSFQNTNIDVLYCAKKAENLCRRILKTSNKSADILITYEKTKEGLYKSDDGKIYISVDDIKSGNYIPKRIYTVEEASKVSKPTGNTFRLIYK